MFVNPLTARDTLPSYRSDTKAVNSVTSVKRHAGVLVTLRLYIEGFYVMSMVVPQGYSAKLPGTILQPWGPGFGIWADFFDYRMYTLKNDSVCSISVS